MATVVKMYAFDGMQGGSLEFGTFSIDPASIADNANGETTVTITGADTGDLIFVNAVTLTTGLYVMGARVSAADTVAIKLGNESGGAIDGGAVTYQYMLVKVAA